MKIECSMGDIREKRLMSAYANRIFVSALDIFQHRIRGVKVTLRDINGPRGGTDKVCFAKVETADGRTIYARARSDDSFRAISLASDRLQRQIVKLMGKMKARRNRARLKEQVASPGSATRS